MKKNNLFIGALSALLLVGAAFPINAHAETLNDYEENASHEATINEIQNDDIISVSIAWEPLNYNYVKTSGDNYDWQRNANGYKNGGGIFVRNNSNIDIVASASWTPSIEGVEADFDYTKKTLGNGTCKPDTNNFIRAFGKDYWNNTNGTEGTYEFPSSTKIDRETYILYTDNTCETMVDTGSVYSESNTYYYVEQSTSQGDGAEVVLPAAYTINNAPFTVVGGYYSIPMNGGAPKQLSTIAEFNMILSGGTLEDVEDAFDGDKVIGTVTVTIDENI